MTNYNLRVAVMFFSATENCKRIAMGIGNHFCANDLIDITYKLNEELTLPYCDILFVVFPVYSQLCPTPIKRFLKRLQFKGAVVPCVSYGSVSAGKALKQICTIFKKRGASVLLGAEIASTHFYYDDNFNVQDLHSKESKVIEELCLKAILRFNKGEYLSKIPVRHFNPLALILPKLRTQIGVKLKPIDGLACAKCNKCHNSCPFGAIGKGLKANRNCLRCGACVKLCKQDNRRLIARPIVRKYLKKHIGKSNSIIFY